jgi:hypothetical protein
MDLLLTVDGVAITNFYVASESGVDAELTTREAACG